MTEVHQLSSSALTAHAFNADRSQVAVSPNNNELQIFARAGAGWTRTETLSEHDKLITSIDWAPRTNRIVTCSHDRNAYVWNDVVEPSTGVHTWQPTLVLLRLNRSATFVRWSPNELKFAVASGARTIAVCTFDEDNDWWTAKQIKKPLRTTVLALEWHPNSVLLAAGSADAKARVFSAFVKGVDAKPTATVWGERLPFNTVCGEFASPCGGWVHGVAFSPSGDALAFAAHDSTITVVYPAGPDQAPQAIYSLQLPSLPSISLLFLTESSLVAAGHECRPALFEGDLQRGWRQVGSLDDLLQKKGGSSTGAAVGGRGGTGAVGRLNQSEAFNMFRAADSRGGSSSGSSATASAASTTTTTGSSGNGTELLTIHQNTITSVRVYEGGGSTGGEVEAVRKISTTGVDGRLVIWDTAMDAAAGLVRGVAGIGL